MKRTNRTTNISATNISATNISAIEDERCRIMDEYLERRCAFLEYLFITQMDNTDYDKRNHETFGTT